MSQLESLSRDDLLKFVKKQTLLQQKLKARCDGMLLFYCIMFKIVHKTIIMAFPIGL